MKKKRSWSGQKQKIGRIFYTCTQSIRACFLVLYNLFSHKWFMWKREKKRESGRERHVMSMPKQNQKYVYRTIPKLEMQLHVKYTLITLIMYSPDNIYPSKWMDQIIIYYLRWHLYSRAEARKANYWKLDYEVHVTAVPSGQPDITIFPMCNLFYPDAGILLSFHF